MDRGSKARGNGASNRRGGLRRVGVHVLRVVFLCAVVVLIHLAHRERETTARARAIAFEVPLGDVRAVLPKAAELGAVDPDTGARDVLDEQGARIGYVVQTSPAGDGAIGFSGPTNLLVGFGPDDRIAGVRVLSSEDTREHVEQVVDDPRFLASYEGLPWEHAAQPGDVDGVSGATLTSLAMSEAIAARLGDGKPIRGSLKFPEPPAVAAVRKLFQNAARLEPDEADPATWNVLDAEGTVAGSVLRTVPAAEDVIGYQGPTETLVGLDREGRIVGVVVGRSYDNEPYVGWVRDEPWYLDVFKGQSLEQAAAIDLAGAGVEGVSGATMTSMAVARSIPEAARARLAVVAEARAAAHDVPAGWTPSPRDVGTAVVVLLALVVGFTSLRGSAWVRVPFQLVLIGYLGFVNGDLLSQALLVGWARHGVPFASTAGLALLTLAALAVPVATKTNLYCSHLCPHGALQQLVRNRLPWRVHLSRRWTRFLSLIPGLLIVWVVVVGMGGVRASLVDIEPFDAYVPTIAGWAALAIFGVGLVASLFVPMAYCRFGCPTGALLGWLRFNARSDRLGWRDAIALGCVVLAGVLYVVG